jgi:hypothetical protein
MNAMVEEIYGNRKKHMGSSFYSAMDEFQYKSLFDNKEKPSNAVIYEDKRGKLRQALSPTKRLIVMKNNHEEHKRQIMINCLAQGRDKVYMATPNKSYVVKEPMQWERDASASKINYDLARGKTRDKT